MKETDLSESKVDDSFCSYAPKPAARTAQCVATAPCLSGPHCSASGGGWTGFDASGPGGCGLGGKTNLDGGSGSHGGIHNCTCAKSLDGPWELQTRNGNQNANGCKNLICQDKDYVACKFDIWLLITGSWDEKWKQLNVTGADPKVCPKAPPLPSTFATTSVEL